MKEEAEAVLPLNAPSGIGFGSGHNRCGQKEQTRAVLAVLGKAEAGSAETADICYCCCCNAGAGGNGGENPSIAPAPVLVDAAPAPAPVPAAAALRRYSR